MAFGKFKPSTKKEQAEYAERAKIKEKTKSETEKKIKEEYAIEKIDKRFRVQIEKCAENNKSLRLLLANKHSKVVAKNGNAFLIRYFVFLATKKRTQEIALEKDPKIRLSWPIVVPELNTDQSRQFCYEVEGTWCAFAWDDFNELLEIAIGKPHKLPELSTVAELTKRAMRQVLGTTFDKSGFSLRSPKDTLQLWEPLRKKYMGKKQKLIEQIEAIDEPINKKKKRAAEIADLDEDEVPKSKKVKQLKKELDGKASKKEKLNGKAPKEEKKERAPRQANLKDENKLKPMDGYDYTKGMGEVFALLPKKGITVAQFFKDAKKKKMDLVRTRIYLSTMRRDGAVTVS